MSMSDLRAKRRKIAQEIVDLQERLERADRIWTESEKREFEDRTADLERVDKLIDLQAMLDSGQEVRENRYGPYEDNRSRVQVEDEGTLKPVTGSYFEARKAEGWSQPWHGDIEHLSIGDFFVGMVRDKRPDIIIRALAEGTVGPGGAIVPDPLRAKIIDRLWETLVLRQAQAQYIPLESDQLYIGRVDNAPSVKWIAENAVISSTDMNFSRVTLTPYKAAGISQASREFVMDAYNAPQVIEAAYLGSMARAIEDAALIGASTSGGPTGLYESTAITSQSVNGSTVARIKWDDVANGWETLAAANVPTDRLSVVCSPRTFKHLGIQKSTGDGAYMNRPGLLDRVQVLPTAAIQDNLTVGATTNASWAAMGDFRSMLLAVRLEPQVEVLKERYADYFQYGFLGAARIGVNWTHDASFLNLTNLST